VSLAGVFRRKGLETGKKLLTCLHLVGRGGVVSADTAIVALGRVLTSLLSLVLRVKGFGAGNQGDGSLDCTVVNRGALEKKGGNSMLTRWLYCRVAVGVLGDECWEYSSWEGLSL